jgi:hypothetical protein
MRDDAHLRIEWRVGGRRADSTQDGGATASSNGNRPIIRLSAGPTVGASGELRALTAVTTGRETEQTR